MASRNRVRFVAQQSDAECGLACLVMVLNAFGCPITLFDLRRIYPVGRDGIGIKRLAGIARHFGLNARALATEGIDLSSLPKPLVLHWDLCHWVVLASSRKSKFVVFDPKLGRQRLSPEQFSKHFSGVLLVFAPTRQVATEVPVDRSPGTWSFLSQIIREIHGRPFIAAILIASLVIQATSVVSPAILQFIVDRLLPSPSSNKFFLLVVCVCMATLTYVSGSAFRALALIRLRTTVDLQAMKRIVHHLLLLPFEYFQMRSRGDLVGRVTGFTTVREIVTEQAISGLLDGLSIVGFLIWLLLISPVLAAIAVAFAAIQIFTTVVTYERQQENAQTIYAASAEQLTSLLDVLHGVEFIKASGVEELAWSRWSRTLTVETSSLNKRGYLNTVLASVGSLCTVGGTMTVIAVGARLAMNRSLTVGAFVGASVAARALLAPVGTCASAFQQLQSVSAHVDRVDDIIRTPAEQKRRSSADGKFLGAISFREVRFSYPGAEEPLIPCLNLEIAPQQVVGLIGATGSGKSTIAMLMLTLLSPTAGEILYDGRSCKAVAVQELRYNFAYVPQTPPLFRGTLRDNLAFGLRDVDSRIVREACDAASLSEEIEQMPMGLDTLVTEEGANFSGGQRQRIALARALIRRPRFLVLDEATSHLDPETEYRINRALKRIACTKLVITHRPALLQDADWVYLIERGGIIDQGSPSDLLSRGGQYAWMAQESTGGQIREAH